MYPKDLWIILNDRENETDISFECIAYKHELENGALKLMSKRYIEFAEYEKLEKLCSAAVKGRKEFREAYRKERLHNKDIETAMQMDDEQRAKKTTGL